MCKERLHDEFNYKNKELRLLEYKETTANDYLVLESFSQSKNKTLHFCEIPSENLRRKNKDIWFVVGRASTADVRITDISVSRIHSKITFHDGNFYIMDLTNYWFPLLKI